MDRLDVVARGRILQIREHYLRLRVSSYYKGFGGPVLEVEVFGLGGPTERMDWSGMPRVGDELLIGARQQTSGLRNEVCQPFYLLKPGQALNPAWEAVLGPGRAPAGAPDPPWYQWLLPGALVLLSGLGGAWYLMRRDRKGAPG